MITASSASQKELELEWEDCVDEGSGGSNLLKIEWGKEIQSPRMTFLVSKGKAMLRSFPKVFLLRNCHVTTIAAELCSRSRLKISCLHSM